jgi:hypothetical protein
VVDFSFIHDRVAGLYCPDNGRPPRARGQAEGLLLDHRIGDSRLRIIAETYATPAIIHDSIVYLGRLDRQRQRFDFDVAAD